jgi:MFS family permease
LPNLVPDHELTNANSLLQTIENGAWMIGPVLGGVMVSLWSPSVPYAVNAVTFLISAALVARIGESQLRSEESLTSGHWRDVADGVRLVLKALPLRTVLIVWSIVLVGSAAINVAEVFFVQDNLGAGDIGFGAIVGASGAGLVIGSFLAAPALGKVGLRRHYAGSIALMSIGWGGAALSPSIWIALPFVIGGSAGNGAAIICNQILVQRGAPDRFRGRALATIMSTNYVVIGLGMGTTGLILNWYSARWVMLAAAAVFGFGAVAALLVTRWLPVRSMDEDHLLEAYGEAAAVELIPLNALVPASRVVDPLPSVPVRDGAAMGGLERIAVLLEEIEDRREREAARRSAT